MSISISLFVLLIIVLSLDAFTAGLSYGVEKVRVPVASSLIIAALSGCMLTFSMTAGAVLLTIIPLKYTKVLSFSILFLLSLYKFYDTLPRLRHSDSSLTTNNISQKINTSDKAVLSGKEALFLGLALSVDNISAGLCTGSASLSPILLLFLTTIVHLLAIRSGLSAGRLLAQKTSHHFAWLGGAILMLLSILRLF